MHPFKSQKPLSLWLSEYAVSHQNPTNKRIHYICVPIIFLTIVALLYHISTYLLAVVTIGVLWFYVRLSLSSFIAMLAFYGLCLGVAVFAPVGIWFWVEVFVVAWIGQFVGHKVEGAKPSFFEDLQFLLIGPLWVAFALFGKTPARQS
ncbi:Protein of uncharacterised function (DUF962) [Moraxella caprae]|uniref:Protein of uncharacterized function (DUF962) n=1 Tax=Moraxella caprae TaxID=90240 RepID=A0A378R1Y5_9GAMM|nr:Mpo1-like protein [Moraxella caprae]STZ09235.1 Protein of uncharacterised function (DUF962) [Moraxella caprae]